MVLMAIPEQKMPILDNHPFAEYNDTESDCSDIDFESDDSESDPSYDVRLEETHTKFSDLSIKKKQSRPRVVQHLGINYVTEAEKTEVFDENDEDTYELVKRLIRDGQLAKLKVDQCKVYLRKNGLRRTGNKDTLLQRIKEHCVLINDGGEKKYPAYSFVLNCKGDACKGDVVLFEQNVYDKFNLASRSASGPSLGKRTVAGRIVHESYGDAKQQHTFTIEVLWSKGERPLPPLHPLLIKGRNLYRLKTMRQRWEDEGERLMILKEKHSRGIHARSDRESRIQERENRKTLKAERKPKKREEIKNQSLPCPKHTGSTSQPGMSFNTVTSAVPSHQFPNSVCSQKTITRPQEMRYSRTSEQQSCRSYQPFEVTDSRRTPTEYDHNHNPVDRWHRGSDYSNQSSRDFRETWTNFIPNNQQGATDVHPCFRRQNLWATNCMQPPTRANYLAPVIPRREDYMRPPTRANYLAPGIPRRDDCMQKQLCRYFSQCRCYYGENCKYSHELR